MRDMFHLDTVQYAFSCYSRISKYLAVCAVLICLMLLCLSRDLFTVISILIVRQDITIGQFVVTKYCRNNFHGIVMQSSSNYRIAPACRLIKHMPSLSKSTFVSPLHLTEVRMVDSTGMASVNGIGEWGINRPSYCANIGFI